MNSTNKLKALAGLPIVMSDNSCIIYPRTLKEIAEIGLITYFKYVNLLTLTQSEIKHMIKEEVSPFTFLFLNANYKEDFKKEFEKALVFFIQEPVLLLSEMETISVGNFEESRMLSDENFMEFQEILRFQNFIETEVVKFAGENESAKHIKQRLAKAKEKVERSKREREKSDIELADLIGSLSIKSPLNINEIWGLSYYAFNDQFKRMRLLESYQTGLQSIMAGADPKKIKLQDWIQSIQ